MGRHEGASPFAIISIVMVCSDRPFFDLFSIHVIKYCVDLLVIELWKNVHGKSVVFLKQAIEVRVT